MNFKDWRVFIQDVGPAVVAVTFVYQNKEKYGRLLKTPPNAAVDWFNSACLQEINAILAQKQTDSVLATLKEGEFVLTDPNAVTVALDEQA